MCVRAHVILLGTSILGNRFGTLANSMFSKFTGEKEADCSLNFSAGNGGAFVVVSQARCFGGYSFENIVDEAVHD